jgi:type I restriction enzyme S subunit
MNVSRVRLADVAEQIRGVSYSGDEASATARDGYLPILRAGNIGEDGLNFLDLVFVPASRVALRQKLRPGDIVVAASSGSLDVVGKAAAVTSPFDGSVGAFCKVVRPSARVDPRFLAHYFRTPQYRTIISHKAAGANISNLRNEDLEALEIPLPELREQRRIANILDRADALRSKRRDALAELSELGHSVFHHTFGQYLQRPAVTADSEQEPLPHGWRRAKLSDVARLATGHTPSRRKTEYWGGDIPWISLTDIRRADGTVIGATGESVTQDGIDNSASVVLPEGTVCFSRTASVGFVTVMGRSMATSQDFVNWVCGPELSPRYLMACFIASRESLRAMSAGSTHRTIYFPTVERFHVVVPPLSLQLKFAACSEAIDKLKAQYKDHLARLDELFASLQHRAFHGEL